MAGSILVSDRADSAVASRPTPWITISARSGWADNESDEAPAPRERSRATRDPQTCRVLVVDDDDVILGAVAGILGQEGYRVDTATNGAEALEAIERSRPHLVLLVCECPSSMGGPSREWSESGTSTCVSWS